MSMTIQGPWQLRTRYPGPCDQMLAVEDRGFRGVSVVEWPVTYEAIKLRGDKAESYKLLCILWERSLRPVWREEGGNPPCCRPQQKFPPRVPGLSVSVAQFEIRDKGVRTGVLQGEG